ncbi:23053_t:CDS:2, partial [Gigaspora rosea]
YQDLLALDINFSAELAILAMPYEELGVVEYDNDPNTTVERRVWCYEKTLNLAIAMDRIEELYKIYKNFASKIEGEVVNEVENVDNIAEFVLTISNPTSVKTKGWPKESNIVNLDTKGKRKQIPEHNQGDKENKVGKP